MIQIIMFMFLLFLLGCSSPNQSAIDIIKKSTYSASKFEGSTTEHFSSIDAPPIAYIPFTKLIKDSENGIENESIASIVKTSPGGLILLNLLKHQWLGSGQYTYIIKVDGIEVQREYGNNDFEVVKTLSINQPVTGDLTLTFAGQGDRITYNFLTPINESKLVKHDTDFPTENAYIFYIACIENKNKNILITDKDTLLLQMAYNEISSMIGGLNRIESVSLPIFDEDNTHSKCSRRLRFP